MNKKLTKHSNSTGGYYETTDDYNEGYTPRDYSEYTPVTKNKSSYVSTYGGYSGGTKYWENWEKRFSSYSSMFDNREKRMKIRNSFEKIARELYIPLEVRFSAQEECSSIKKSSRVTIDLDSLNIESIKDKKRVREILSATERLPENATLADNTLFSIGILERKGHIPFKWSSPHDFHTSKTMIRNYYLSGVGDITEFRKWLVPNEETKKEEKKNEESESALYGNWHDGYLSNTPKELVSFLENAIKSKFYFPDSVNKEENYRKGNRINRGFMNGTSYKPLVGKTKVAHKKKKIMIVIDGSGSMSDYGKGEFGSHKVMHIASAFAAGLINSGLFDVKYSITHHCSGWKNMLSEYSQRNVRGCSAGGEGFQNIDETIPESYPKEADYVVFLTDMEIGTSSQEGMAAFLKRAKKHMILSFQKGGSLQGLNVRQIDSFNGMTNALATLLS